MVESSRQWKGGKRLGPHPSRKIPGRRKWPPTPEFLGRNPQTGQRSLAGYSPWGHKESDMSEHLSIYIFNSLWLALQTEKLKRYFLLLTNEYKSGLKAAPVANTEAWRGCPTGEDSLGLHFCSADAPPAISTHFPISALKARVLTVSSPNCQVDGNIVK